MLACLLVVGCSGSVTAIEPGPAPAVESQDASVAIADDSVADAGSDASSVADSAPDGPQECIVEDLGTIYASRHDQCGKTATAACLHGTASTVTDTRGTYCGCISYAYNDPMNTEQCPASKFPGRPVYVDCLYAPSTSMPQCVIARQDRPSSWCCYY